MREKEKEQTLDKESEIKSELFNGTFLLFHFLHLPMRIRFSVAFFLLRIYTTILSYSQSINGERRLIHLF